MQKHKRWLVITIWISTIAFVGAGFVGWGSYEYGKEGGTVAVVDNREISIEEYQEEYSNLYDQYSRLFGETFNKDMADKLNLKDIAYKQIIEKNLILAYGDTLNLNVTDTDIAKQLLKYNAFVVEGKFDKATYVKVLAQNRTTPAKFEDSLKRNILLQKVQQLFEVQTNAVAVENLNTLLFAQDDITIKILESKNITVTSSDDELKTYWEANKNAYMSEIAYDLKTSQILVTASNPAVKTIEDHYKKFKNDYKKADGKLKNLDEATAEIIKELDAKATKKDALKKYLKIKKSEEELVTTLKVDVSKLPFSDANNKKIIASKDGDLIKPFLENGKYIIVKVLRTNASTPLSYEDALAQVKVSYAEIAKDKKLNELALEELKNFTGTKITNVSRDSVDKITLLNTEDASAFLNQLFSATTKEGSIKLADKVVLYRIDSSKFGAYDKTKDAAVKSTLEQLQSNELMANLVKSLEKTFDIQSSVEAKE
jgi:peptidyl-prolyl cis-trans isomerase D